MDARAIKIAVAIVVVAAAAFLLYRQYRVTPLGDAAETITIVFPDGSEVTTTMAEIYKLAGQRPAKAYADERGNWNVVYPGKPDVGLVKRQHQPPQTTAPATR